LEVLTRLLIEHQQLKEIVIGGHNIQGVYNGELAELLLPEEPVLYLILGRDIYELKGGLEAHHTPGVIENKVPPILQNHKDVILLKISDE
jgi:hypothetical protein